MQKCNFYFVEFAVEQKQLQLTTCSHNCAFSIQHPCYFTENKVHFVPLIHTHRVQYNYALASKRPVSVSNTPYVVAITALRELKVLFLVVTYFLR